MFSLHVKQRKQLQTETGSASGPVLFTSCEMVYTAFYDVIRYQYAVGAVKQVFCQRRLRG